MKGGELPSEHTLPTFNRVLFDLMAFIVIQEIGFYYTHRYLAISEMKM
jgi:hypothetical protein